MIQHDTRLPRRIWRPEDGGETSFISDIPEQMEANRRAIRAGDSAGGRRGSRILRRALQTTMKAGKNHRHEQTWRRSQTAIADHARPAEHSVRRLLESSAWDHADHHGHRSHQHGRMRVAPRRARPEAAPNPRHALTRERHDQNAVGLATPMVMMAPSMPARSEWCREQQHPTDACHAPATP